MQFKLYKERLSGIPPVAWINCLIFIIFSISSHGFLSFSNLLNICVQGSPLLIVAIGETMVILTQGIDLSVGYVLGFSGVCTAIFINSGAPVSVAILVGLFVGGLSGFVNGVLITKSKLPPFIATLGVGSIAYGIGLLLTGGKSILANQPVFRFIFEGKFFTIPMPIVLAIFIFWISWILIKKTALGRNIISLGGNAEALRVAGINIGWALILTYTISGLLAGVSGVIIAARAASGYAAAGLGWEFDAIAATIIGGTSFEEGKGGIGFTVLGVLLISILRNGLNIAGVTSMYQYAVIGIVVLSAIVIDVKLRRA